jgi:hypothetical protein
MSHLTLQEVISRINKDSPVEKDPFETGDGDKIQSHRPEFYIPRITRIFARLWFGA